MERFIQRKTGGMLWSWVLLVLLALSSRLAAQPQGSVKTLAGAFAGFADGFGNVANGAQFDGPLGLALTKDNRVLVADSGNNLIRAVRTTDQYVTTVIPPLFQINRLQKPVAVAVDTNGVIYVANETSHWIQKYDRFGNFITNVVQTPSVPTALAIGQGTSLYVAELNGVVKRYNSAGAWTGTYQFTVPVATPNALEAEFRGIAVFQEGKLAVSDSANHVIWVFNTTNDVPVLFGGTVNQAGFANGTPGYGLLNHPLHIAAGLNNSLVIADWGNHRIRVLGCDGTLDTMYGVDPSQWEVFPDPAIFPGWLDGSPQFAESREPVGLTVGADGTVYGSEVYYHLVRAATGLTYPDACAGGSTGGGTNSGGGTNGGSTNVVIQAPILTPNSGYYPMGVKVEVSSPASSSGFGGDVNLYYTTDGTDPTTNSAIVQLVGGKRVIEWRSTALDLTSLRVRSQTGTNVSLVARGISASFDAPSTLGEVGIAPSLRGTNFIAGLGSTLILPVVANLRSGVELQSLQMVVEVSPVNPAGTARIELPLQPKALTMSSNDFVAMAMASTNAPLTFLSNLNGTNRLAVVYIGTNSLFKVSPFGTVAVLSIPIPPQADSLGHKSSVGSQYLIRIVEISGTSDGQQAVLLKSMPDRVVTVGNEGYLVGDTAPGSWYNAGDFGDEGDGLLRNADVNNAFYASLGFKVPYAASDAFNAMDVVPEDTLSGVGGDGEIRFLDWQILLRRSLGFNANFWRRAWTQAGVRKAFLSPSNQPLDVVAPLTAKAAPEGYHRPVRISADTVGGITQQELAQIPVRLRVKPGAAVAGLQFVAYVTSDQGEPTVGPVSFVPAAGLPQPSLSGNSIPGVGTLNNAFFCSWNVGAFVAPLEGSVLLGNLTFRMPGSAISRGRYSVHFEKADGAAADFQTMYAFESLRGDVWVNVSPLLPPETLPDEWKIYHFGSLIDADAQASADPEHDGFSNFEEYLAGTDPSTADWRVSVSEVGAQIRWFGHANAVYTVERSRDLKTWEQVGTPTVGQDQMVIYSDTSAAPGNQYYRFRIR